MITGPYKWIKWNKYVQLFQVYLFKEAMKFNLKDVSSYPLPITDPPNSPHIERA